MFIKEASSDEDYNLVLKSELELLDSSSPCKKDTGDDEDDCDVDEVPGYMTIPPDHNPDKLTKEVPPHILYTRKGVRCHHCWHLFKCKNAVDVLVQHTKDKHPKIATASYLNKLREDNSFDKLIGNGMRYCTCKYCKVFGIARFHDGFPKRRRRCLP